VQNVWNGINSISEIVKAIMGRIYCIHVFSAFIFICDLLEM